MTKYILGIVLVAALVACGLLYRRWKRAKSRHYTHYVYLPKTRSDVSDADKHAFNEFYRVKITRRSPFRGE